MRYKRHQVLILLLIAVIMCPLLADGRDDESKKSKRPRTKRIAGLHDREELRERLPIELKGLESDDNSFRDRTPSLEKSDKRAALVDSETNYERRLAMIEEGRTFHAPLPLAAGFAPTVSKKPNAAKGVPAKTEEEKGFAWWFILPGIILLLIGALILYNRGTREEKAAW